MPSDYPASLDPIPLPEWDGALGQPARTAEAFLTDIVDSIQAVQVGLGTSTAPGPLRGAGGSSGGSVVDVRDFGATGSGDETIEIQDGIDALEAAGGGTLYFPASTYTITGTLEINDDNVSLLGRGGGHTQNGVPDLRATAATRFIFDAGATPATMVRFTSVAGEAPKVGGGISGIMLDGNNNALRCLSLRSWRSGRFDDLTCFAATGEMVWMGQITGTLPVTPYDCQYNTFTGLTTSAKNQTGNTARGVVMTGGWGVGSTAPGNCSANMFRGCQITTKAGDALVLEDSDANFFYDCFPSVDDAASGYSLVLGSYDQTSSGNTVVGGTARRNQFFGGQFQDGVFARSSQTGHGSSEANSFYGYSYGNGSPAPTIEAPAGGSLAATVRVYSEKGAENLDATAVALGNNTAVLANMRAAMGTESLRVGSGASNHIKLESGDGASVWSINIDNTTGDLRLVRASGTGKLSLNTRPNVTGSRGGNAALASLLTGLDAQGIITDSSSA